MRKSNTEHIGTVLQHFLREEGLETPYNQFRLIKSLEEVLGHGISRYIGNAFVRNQTLTCYNGIKGDGCGECPACKLRRRGLEKYLKLRQVAT